MVLPSFCDEWFMLVWIATSLTGGLTWDLVIAKQKVSVSAERFTICSGNSLPENATKTRQTTMLTGCSVTREDHHVNHQREEKQIKCQTLRAFAVFCLNPKSKQALREVTDPVIHLELETLILTKTFILMSSRETARQHLVVLIQRLKLEINPRLTRHSELGSRTSLIQNLQTFLEKSQNHLNTQIQKSWKKGKMFLKIMHIHNLYPCTNLEIRKYFKKFWWELQIQIFRILKILLKFGIIWLWSSLTARASLWKYNRHFVLVRFS